MTHRVTKMRSIYRFDGQKLTADEDPVAVERPLTIRLDGEEFATIVCSPADLVDLTVGFLASEGVIRLMDDIQLIHMDEEQGYAHVELVRKQTVSKDYYAKRFIGSCCGKSRQFYFHNDMRTAKTVTSTQTISAQKCVWLLDLLNRDAADFQQTGGVHNAALCTTEAILQTRVDIGRHNALDKIFGHCIQSKLRVSDKILAFSGRMSSEVVLKAAKIGSGILLTKSAPTDLGLELAHDLGITTVGFIRRGRFNVYTHPQRITLND